ncbi:hypothetical protein [Streptomyces sp. MST-110588]|uniref:hypothetical protein n=1 Tax=Streptomyces sp. MST-110588 TaxID=2833628 RepID=UPI001F5DB167|nr:hypothetical protein [Streptomyces sp. MST-110588]UNO44421.1 hypothetical protein KGS77_06265 [Streptomyces sp. MST-110588]
MNDERDPAAGRGTAGRDHERRRARLALAQHARDAEDLAELLDMLDLHPERDGEPRPRSGVLGRESGSALP